MAILAFDPDAYLNEGKNTSGFDPDAYLGITPPAPTLKDRLPGVIKQSAEKLIGIPIDAAKQALTMSPGAQKLASSLLPTAVGLAGAPFGLAAPGAALGEVGREAANTIIDPSNVPQTGLGRFASTVGAGVMQEPKILNAIPGVPQTAEVLSNVASKFGKGLARAGETLSGVKKDVLQQAYKGGLSTYGAPSLPKAQQIFGAALGPEGRAAMKQTAAEAFDPALQKARDLATEIGTKIEEGHPVTAIEALKARQATDRVISGTPVTDKITRNALYGWRNQFDNELASQSGELADASRTYRQAIVKDKITNLTRMNKSGEPSAFLPMLVGHSMVGKGIEGGLGMLTGTSPAVWGLGATTAGQAAKGLNVVGQSPLARQALLQVLQKINAAKAQQGQPPVLAVRG